MDDIKTIIQFEAHDDHFLPWDFSLDSDNKVVGKSPYQGQKVIGFAPAGDLDSMPILTVHEGWQDRVKGLVPVMSSEGNMYQLTSHTVRKVRPIQS